MHKVKSLLLGTVAGFAALGSAQAADMPAKARPVQYVKICKAPRGRLLLHPRHRHMPELPGIVTAMALNSTFTQVLGVSLGLLTIVIGHATFCIVVVFNNVVARLRRTSPSFEEASADLGANGLQTFRYVVFPQLRSALVAGALLAFALSFDEIIVTTFTAGQQQTLPIWIFANLSRPRQLPIVNVVAVMAILLSLIPVWIAQRITADPVSAGAARGEVGGEAGA